MSRPKIVEMIPDDMPKWAKDAMDEGQFFRVAVDRVKVLEDKIKKLGSP